MRKWLTGIFIVWSLAACAVRPAIQEPQIEEGLVNRTEQPFPQEDATLAAREFKQGWYLQAGGRYRKLANQTNNDSGLNRLYRLRAADALSRASLNEEAITELAKLDSTLLSSQQGTTVKLIRARDALARQRPQEALDNLPRQSFTPEKDAHLQTSLLRAEASYQQGRLEEHAKLLIEIEALIVDPRLKSLHHERIWDALQTLPQRQRNNPPEDLSSQAAGWWSLAAIINRYSNSHSSQRSDQLASWRLAFPEHPADENLLNAFSPPMPQLWTGVNFKFGVPGRVALLVPLSGPLAYAGRLIKTGFERALDLSSVKPKQLKVYDSAGEAQSIDLLYHQAVSEGAEFIVGPLTKEATTRIAERGWLEVPVLALNNIQTGIPIPANMFLFGLNPEDEARATVAQAVQEGHYRAAVLVSEDDLGTRIGDAFIEQLQGLNGTVVEYKSFPPMSNNLNEDIYSLLKPESDTPLWRDIRGEDRAPILQHIDMIFVSGNPRDIRLIRPLLRFHHAMDLPVYSTARSYTTPDPYMDKDLEGVIFCDMPAVLEIASLEEDTSRSGGIRLESFGGDAYHLMTQLERLSTDYGASIRARTGILSLDEMHRVRRELLCAAFHNGRPELLRSEN